MMTSSEGPLFGLASGPPTLNPPLHVGHSFSWRSCVSKRENIAIFQRLKPEADYHI